MNLYVAGAVLGATTTAAVTAVWILGPGGSAGTGGSGVKATEILDMQVAPYMARVEYQGGSSALVPISIAFRISGKSNAQRFCRDIAKIQNAVNAYMRRNVGNKFEWASISSSGLDKRLAERINDIVGGGAVRKVLMEAGDKGAGNRTMTCSRLARQG